ncbi:MAG: leucine-rich repeat protein [Roseburia faecis]
MKKWKERGKRIAVLLLTAALVGSSVDVSALTVNAAEEEKVLTCEKGEHTHDDSCYKSVLICTEEAEEHGHDDSCYEDKLICEKEEHTHDDSCYTITASSDSEDEKQEDESQDDTTVTGDSPEQTASEETETSEEKSEEITETAKRITSWTWNDEEEMLDLEENVLALPGASKDYIVSFDDIVSFLPASITATITTSASVTETEDTEATNESEETDGAEETVTLEGWVCENYPEEGAYSGNYTFTANLPEGYELAEDAAALKVNVELGGAQLLEATTITPTKPENGNGTAENPYQITSAAELYWFAGLVNGTLTDVTKNSSACAKLMNDITVNNNLLDRITYKTDDDGNLTNEVANGGNFISWTPIGAANNGYQGTFDGNGKTISGLFFNDSQKSHVGLFDNIYMATIRNVGVVDSYFFGEHYVGGVCAFGVDGTITGSYNTGVVSGEGCVGGVCGTGSSVTITDSYNTGSVSGNDDVGGVFGYGENCTINNCYYLKAEGTDLGGINGADVEGQAEGKTAAQFASGEVAYLLQDGQKVGEDGTIPQVWGQNIDNDGEKQSFPVFSNAKVYKPSESSPCKVGYTNNAEGLKEHDFGDDKTGESCSYCNIKNINYSGISISGVDTPYYYTGNEIKPDITIKKGETSLTLGEDYNITYGNNTDVAGSNAENAPYVKITGKGNYTGEITKNFTIAYITAPDNYITGTKGANDWYTSDVTIGVADWQVSTDGSSWNDSISVTEEGTHSYTLYFKDSNGYITDSINKEIKIDKAAPTGTIQVKESTWDKFLEKISFGFYTNTKEKITITSEDTGSGIASTEYLVSDKAYTQISDMQNLSGWKDYDNSNKPKIKTNRTNYVYARITDNVGNVTYLSSDGILHDDEKPYIFDITPVMKNRSGSVTFDIFEDGSGLEKVYFLYSTDINEVTSATTENLKASDYHNATGTFTLSDLKPNTEYYCAVLAVDKAGNESYLLNSTFKTLKEAITGTVSISGEAVYGKTLTASYEGLATDAGEVTVSWYRGEDTTAIATGDTYTLTADDVGKVITVKVTAENCSGELTDSTAEVAKAEHPNPPTNGNVDDENNTFTFNGTSGVTYEYSTDGGASWTDITVDSGTGVGTVTVGNVIVNTGDLQVRAKGTDVYKASTVISNTSAYTATLEGSVSLSGTAKYGETLTATVTGAQQGAVLTYTFCVDDTVLQQGSSNTYKIEQAAIGKQITVKVSAEGYKGTVNGTSDTVAKADGVLTLKQTEFTPTFGDEAFELGCSRTGDGTISYKVSDSKKADGTAADDDNSVIKVSDTGVVTIVGAGSATVTVSLSETKCYTGAAEQTITVTVNKAPKPPKMPGSIMHPAHSKNKVGDVELPQGWAWADSDKEITLEDGKAVTATANYVGSDAGNYKNESVEITLTRSECDHPKTELKNAKPATCKETGYTGDTYCVKCEELVVSGTEIPLGKHQGGKATCTHQAVCTVCGASYGDLDSSNHTFGEWKVVVAATTTEAGKKERSCVCGYKETADIPKLDVQTPETPSTPAPGTPSTPAPETPSTPAPETPAVKTPKKGDIVTDDKKTGSYIITSSEKKEVAYKAPANKNAKTITIPATIKVKGVTYKVTKIADNSFKNNNKITKITIGENIVSIGKNAFYGCKKLKTITIRSKKLTSKTVSKNAFKGLTKITTIKVPKNKLTAYKKLLKKKGLSSKVKVKGY